jgi:octanoyl-[GcvH]:protein N-octanoyltransferase
MTLMKENYLKDSFLFIDSGCLTAKNSFQPFAMTDVFTHFSGQNKQPIIHFWQLDQTMILGMKDTRMPYLKDGLNELRKSNYHIIVRNAGGLGVIADQGVLNVSLILPNLSENKLSIDQAYEIMWLWLKEAFPEKDIAAYEIAQSYCPGQYDLSIDGKKFAGIAQRRVKNGLSVMIYISVSGDQLHRGNTVRHFYQAGLKEQFGLNGYPPVAPESMANLAELLEKPLSVEAVKNQLLSTITTIFEGTINTQLTQQLLASEWYQTNMTQQIIKMQQRNALLKEEYYDNCL